MKLYLLKMFGISLLLTLGIEWAIAFLWGVRRKKEWLLITLVNIVTNPLAVLSYWLYRIYVAGPSIAVQVVIEIIVVLAEALIYRSFAKEEGWQLKNPVLLAVVSNIISWGVGLLL